jgi:hypothetical protein
VNVHALTVEEEASDQETESYRRYSSALCIHPYIEGRPAEQIASCTPSLSQNTSRRLNAFCIRPDHFVHYSLWWEKRLEQDS